MRVSIVFLSVLFSLQLVAQEEIKLPEITPPSPEAAALTKYANLQANEFNGLVSYNLPLYTFEAGQIKLPISLNYVGGGVKVNDLPTWVGMNWTLDIGGVITRVMRDRPDEWAQTRVIFSPGDVENYDNTPDCTEDAEFLQDIADPINSWDSEADLFSFSFAGHSGTFFFDEDFETVQQSKKSELRIEVTGTEPTNQEKFIQNKQFKITTPDGIQFYFGGEVVETTTRRYHRNHSESGTSYKDTHERETAYYLTEIVHPVNGRILFSYETDSLQIHVTQETQKIIKIIKQEPENNICFCLNPPYDCDVVKAYPCLPDPDTNKYENTTVSLRNLSPRYLSKIYRPNSQDTVFVNSSSIDNRHFFRVLNNISVNRDTSVVKTIDFDYVGFQASENPLAPYSDVSKRFFLSKVIFDIAESGNYQDGRKNEVYSFQYNNPSALPPRFDYSQDYLGYYNGVTNPNPIPRCEFTSPGGIYDANFANRTPDFSYSSYGTLTDIFYPTGGKTHFDYEAKKTKRREFEQGVSLYAYRLPAGQSKLIDYVPQWIDQNTLVKLDSIPFSQSVDFIVTIKATGGATTISPQGDKAIFRIYNYNDPQAPILLLESPWLAVPSPSDEMLTTIEKQFVIPFSLDSLTSYKVEVEIYDPPAGDATTVEAWVSMKYDKGTFEILEREGILLRRQTDYADDNSPENIRRYYYGDANNLQPLLDDIPLDSEQHWIDQETWIENMVCTRNESCGGSAGFIDLYTIFTSVSSEKFDNSYSTGVDRFEKVTISYGGDAFERGGIEKTFQILSDYDTAQIRTSSGLNPLNYTTLLDSYGALDFPSLKMPSPLNGLLLNEKTLLNTGTFLAKIAEKQYSYLIAANGTPHISIASKKLYNINFFGPGCTTDDAASGYAFGAYIVPAFRQELEQEKTISYIDPVPLTVQDDSAYRKIITQTDYEYGDLVGLPTSIATTGSDGIQTEVQNFYVNQASALGSPALASTTVYEQMEDLNIVRDPIQVKQFKGGELLSTKRTLYDEWGTDQFLPSAIQWAKGTNPGLLEDRVEFRGYDSRGNLTRVGMVYGAETLYCYNLDNKPTLKIENYPHDLVPLFPPQYYQPPAATPGNVDFTMHDLFSDSMVTVYRYDPVTKLLMSLTDPKRNTVFYYYDSLHRLIRVKDNEGNVVSDFDHNFKKY